ncbi:MAG: ABC transporter permease subunit [Clostridiales bacterium]|jgi:putative aldouronate transport system permease protein|nr:ABC transporter permease subunit [Clostridiales bacterium]
MPGVRKTGLKSHPRREHSGPFLLIALPGLLYLLVNNYIPMFGAFIAFKKLDYVQGLFKSPWTGFDNFKFLFQTKDAFVMVRNTLLYNLAFIALGTVCAVLIAVLMADVSRMPAARFFQAGLLLPNLVSMVIVSYLVYAFLAPETGLVNTEILPAFSMEPINWYSQAKYWPFILILTQMWKTAGYTSIVYIASIAGMDAGMYESARIDGAGKLRQIFAITLPLLKPTIIVMVLMSVGRIFASDFGLFYQVPMDSGALYDVTQTIDTYVYRGLMRFGNVGMSSAAGLFQSVVGFILVLGANSLVKRFSAGDSLF